MAPTVQKVVFGSGKQLPILGYGNGTAHYSKDPTHILEQAVSAGFTLIDSAQMYRNSAYVGKSLAAKSDFPTQVVAKIGDLSKIRESALEERKQLGRDRLDVLLLHLPPRGSDNLPSNVDAWKEMEQLKNEGVADVIGVSNWLASDINEVIQSKPQHAIQVNQIEHHPLLAGSDKQNALLALQRRQGIVSMIYGALTPLTSDDVGDAKQLTDVLAAIAAKEQSWTPATVLFKWASQTAAHSDDGNTSHDGIIITTGNKPERFPGYLSLFDSRRLTEEEVQEISQAGQKHGVLKARMQKYFNGRPQ